MNRRSFVGLSLAAVGGIFAPRFGRWYRRGSGLIVSEWTQTSLANPNAVYVVAHVVKGSPSRVMIDWAPTSQGPWKRISHGHVDVPGRLPFTQRKVAEHQDDGQAWMMMEFTGASVVPTVTLRA